MSENTKWITLISAACTAVSAILAVIVYIRQQRINRLQNLISVFQRFSNSDDFISIFSVCDASYVRTKGKTDAADAALYMQQLMEIPPEKKFKYLALLEEIAIFAKNSAVINKNAIHLFKFHFFYVYGEHQISAAFWYNIGSGPDEKNKEGWEYQSSFAKKCEAHVIA